MSEQEQNVRKLKRIETYGDYIAVYRVPVLAESDLEIDDDLKKRMSNEGIIVCVGPDVKDVELGDCVIFRTSRYPELNPETGGYAGETVLMMRKMDLMVRKDPHKAFEVVEKVE